MNELVRLFWFLLMIALSIGAFIINAAWMAIAIPAFIVVLLAYGILARIFDRD